MKTQFDSLINNTNNNNLEHESRLGGSQAFVSPYI
jgi:hypothetical protein